ncbi:MAG: type IIL restriction-modification enzyme MmeI [Capsulimonas sp.]|uniref:type IIL restriction-modification enzyme MmeI n=1 Tax=Capsulimonas sp. TaxID=2494211 RepID=UPI0032653483
MRNLISTDPTNKELIFPYIGGRELTTSPTHEYHRYVINFADKTFNEASHWPHLLEALRRKVKPERDLLGGYPIADRRREYWWQFGTYTPSLYEISSKLKRVLAISSVGQHCCFAFLSTDIIYSHSLYLITLEQWEALSILQSRIHESWARFLGSSLEDRLRYTPSDCFETFPFPQGWETEYTLKAVGKEYYEFRSELMIRNNEGMTKTYNRFHDPEERDSDILKLRELHSKMDRAVLDAYGWRDIPTECEFILDYEEEDEETSSRRKKPWRYRWPDEVRDEVLARLLKLNAERAAEERAGVDGKISVKRQPKKVVPAAELDLDWDTPFPALLQEVKIREEDIEPAILTWLLARERDPSLIEAHRPKAIRKRAFRPNVKEVHSIRLAKEEYAVVAMAGASAPIEFEEKPRGPLSTTFHQAIERASSLGWLKYSTSNNVNEPTDYELGPNAAEAVQIAFEVLSLRDQEIEDVLHFMEGDALIESERQATVHKAWTDLKAHGQAGTRDEVVQSVQRWKPNRPGFNKVEIYITFQDLKDRKLLR